MSTSPGPDNQWDYLTNAGKKGVHTKWRNEVAANDHEQRLMHVDQQLDYYKDKLSVETGTSRHTLTIIANLENEKQNIIAARNAAILAERNAAILAEQQRTQISQINSSSGVNQQNQSSLIERETTQRPPVDVTPKKISINDLLNKPDTKEQGGTRGPNNESSSLIPFIAIRGFPSIRVMLTNILPVFKVIIPLFLPALLFMDIPYITDIWDFLSRVFGDYFTWILFALFSGLIYLLKLLLIIRKANNSAGSYDRFFTFIANHYKSGLLYLLIFLISLSLMLFCA